MKCFHCINVVCHTEYPPNAIVSVCPRCLWRSKEQLIPSKIPPVQAVSLVNQSESNIFDEYYINNEVRVESMTQKQCGICQCVLFDDDETYECQYGTVDVLCFRSLELLGRVWE